MPGQQNEHRTPRGIAAAAGCCLGPAMSSPDAGPERRSTLTCPLCGTQTTETMPTDACQWFYECEQCHTVLKPKAGDCCVFCSYGTVPCPPIQERGSSMCGCS